MTTSHKWLNFCSYIIITIELLHLYRATQVCRCVPSGCVLKVHQQPMLGYLGMRNTNIINVTTYVLGFLQGNGMFNNTGNPKVPWMKEPTTLTIVKIQKDITGVWHMCKTGVNVLMLFVCGTKDSILC